METLKIAPKVKKVLAGPATTENCLTKFPQNAHNQNLVSSQGRDTKQKKLKAVTVWGLKKFPGLELGWHSSNLPNPNPRMQPFSNLKLREAGDPIWNFAVYDAYLQGEDNERKRISQELHDGLGQMLSAIKINLDLARFHLPEKFYNSLVSIADNAVAEYRAVAHKLVSPIVKTHGLVRALEKMCAEFDLPGVREVRFRFPRKEVSLPPTVEVHLFRICQELLTNAVKHSSASNITIQLNVRGEGVSLSVKDNGIGFDAQNIREEKKGLGLENVVNRIKTLGGTINFFSKPMEGTIAKIHLKLKSYDQTNHHDCGRCKHHPSGCSRSAFLLSQQH